MASPNDNHSPPDHLLLYTTTKAYIVEPVYDNSYSSDTIPTVQISRPTGNILVNEPLPNDVKNDLEYAQKARIFGILGLIQLISGPFIIVATDRRHVGTLLGHSIFRIQAVDILPCSNSQSHLSIYQAQDEEKYLNLLKGYFGSAGLYYSSSYDLTKRLQMQSTSKLGNYSFSLEKVNRSFLANKFILEPFLQISTIVPASRMEDFVIVSIEGFVEFKVALLKHYTIQFGIISRRSTGRTGTRYHSRGIDDKGNVSNCLETEQVAQVDSTVASYVQIRGSIPLYWRQNLNIRYAPPLELNESHPDTPQVLRTHLKGLIDTYGPTAIINLVKRTGWEGKLAKEFSRQVNEWGHPQISYEHFDFHAQCGETNWKNVNILVGRIESVLDTQGYFLAYTTSGEQTGLTVERKQIGINRVNCIDCLDRTNVVQSLLSQRALTKQLIQMNVLNTAESFENYPDLLSVFRNMWADNGDAISRHYAGTGALKSDFTRTGFRNMTGRFRDLYNSLIRYILNNFYDGARQDAMDLFYGNYVIESGTEGELSLSPFLRDRTELLHQLIPLVLGISLSWMFFVTMFGFTAMFTRKTWLMLSFITVVVCCIYIIQNGIHFVQFPKLIPPPVVIKAKAARFSTAKSIRQRLMDAYQNRGKVHII